MDDLPLMYKVNEVLRQLQFCGYSRRLPLYNCLQLVENIGPGGIGEFPNSKFVLKTKG